MGAGIIITIGQFLYLKNAFFILEWHWDGTGAFSWEWEMGEQWKSTPVSLSNANIFDISIQVFFGTISKQDG